ncbi:hypothetical protein GQ55_5G148600 [Panicum hallii var. hallii]|uniref:Uncharacterized protein n=1 Tax=Panicum hallii var. hallii TaxID=1504633 RepID=A0A2T7DGE7_9POAL|nr:hypothetical protein GQ55_5G148600 [Panicum hallii var. hallii]
MPPPLLGFGEKESCRGHCPAPPPRLRPSVPLRPRALTRATGRLHPAPAARFSQCRGPPLPRPGHTFRPAPAACSSPRRWPPHPTLTTALLSLLCCGHLGARLIKG